MSKVLIITYYWPPSGGAGVQRWLKFSKYLPQLGIEPSVLTVDPNYASYPQVDESLVNDVPDDVKVYKTKTFELYNLYTKLSPQKEVPYGGFVNESKPGFIQKAARFVRGNLFLPDPRKGWVKYAVPKAKEIIKKEGIELVITTGTPHSTHFIGRKLKKDSGIKWIVDLRDPWTDIYYYKEMMHTFVAKRYDLACERSVFKNADKIITVSDGLKEIFRHKHDSVEAKTDIVTNGYDASDFSIEKNVKKGEELVLAYIGTITSLYRVDGFLHALKRLVDRGVKVKFRLTGKYSKEIQEKVTSLGLEKITEFTGTVPHNEIPELMQSADVLLLFVPDVPNNDGILTGKLFEYIGSGSYIISVGPQKADVGRVITRINAGCHFGYDDSEGMENEINNLSQQKQEKGIKGASKKDAEQYTRLEQAKKLSEIIEQVIQ